MLDGRARLGLRLRLRLGTLRARAPVPTAMGTGRAAPRCPGRLRPLLGVQLVLLLLQLLAGESWARARWVLGRPQGTPRV